MKKILLLFVLSLCFNTNAQVTVFQDSFESYTDFVITGFGNWQTLDLDLLNTYTGGNANPTWANAGAPQAFQIFNPTAAAVTNATNGVGGETESRNFDPKTGSKYAACWAGVPTATVTANDDWLVSPVINLGASNNEVRFWVKSMSDTYGLEKYRVGVYVGTGTPTGTSSFTTISGAVDLTAPYGTWQEKIFSLNTYSNQSIRIGIRCKTADAYMFMVDDFIVTSSNLRTDEFFSSKFSMYPNPANSVINISNIDNIVMNNISISDINGRTVKKVNVENVNSTQINISELSAGIYFMNISTDSGNAVKKFIKN